MTALLRLEAMAVLRARTLVASLVVAAALVAFFVALATRESSVIAFTGFGRVTTGASLAALFFLPLLALASTAQTVTTARQQGILEWYASQPVSRDACFFGLFLPRLAAVAAPALLMVTGLGAASLAWSQPIAGPAILWLAGLLLAQAWAFAGIGVLISVRVTSPEQALLWALGVWMAAVALLDFAMIGAMLRWNLPPHLVFLLSGVNPVQAGRLGVLSMGDADLGVLGPVGTWISVTLGASGTAAYALGWPLVVGAIAVAVARWSFLRRDLL